MKKIFILPLILILCTGCIKINKEENKDLAVNAVVNSKITPNTMAKGYEYYLPLGISKTYDKDYNQIFKYEDNIIYLYVDVISYFYKNTLNFNEENSTNSYYYRKLTNGEKSGYIKIAEEKEGLYFIKIVYNYAKMECYTDDSNISKVLTNSMIILDSIDYNDNLIKRILDNDYNIGAEKEYKIDKPEEATSRFTEYLNENIMDDETQLSDLPDY